MPGAGVGPETWAATSWIRLWWNSSPRPSPSACALVEAGGHDPAGVGGGADRLVQRRVRPGQLQADVGAPAAGEPGAARPQRTRRRRRRRIGRRSRAACSSRAGTAVDGDHPRAGEHGEPGGEQPDDALAEDRDPVAQVQVAGEHRGQGDRAGAGEDRRRAGRARRAARAPRRRRTTASARCPQMPQTTLPGLPVGDVGRDLDDLADLLVAEARPADSGTGGLSGHEHPAGVVPVLAQPGIAAPVEGQLGAGGDAGVAGADPDLAGAERIRGQGSRLIRRGPARETTQLPMSHIPVALGSIVGKKSAYVLLLINRRC